MTARWRSVDCIENMLKYVKHNDAIDEKLLEFIMYQTGVFIRMIISVK